MTLDEAADAAIATVITDDRSFIAAMNLRSQVYREHGPDDAGPIIDHLDGLMKAHALLIDHWAVERVNIGLMDPEVAECYRQHPEVFAEIGAAVPGVEFPPVIPGVVWTRRFTQ